MAGNNNFNHPSRWVFFKKIAHCCGQVIKTSWLIIGATLLVILFLEGTCALVYHFLPGQGELKYFQNTPSYKNYPWSHDYDHELFSSYNTSWRPYVDWRRTPYKGRYINIDAHGIRYTVPGKVREGNTARKVKIFMFGGSTMWGEGVRDQFTLPSLVGQDLAARHVQAKITNFGEVAYVNTQELIELVLQLEQGNVPDVVVFYDGYTDVTAAFQNHSAGATLFEPKRELEYNISTRYHKLKTVFLLSTLDRFYFGKLIKYFSNKLSYPKPASHESKTLEKDIVEIYLNNCKIIAALGKAYGFVPLFYWQPVIYTKNSLTPFEKKFAPKPLGDLYRQSHAVLQARSQEFAPYHFFDISNLFATTHREVYLDFCHVNEKSNQIIAQRMASDLLQIIGSPARGWTGSRRTLASPTSRSQ
jgi:hypothetical protein